MGRKYAYRTTEWDVYFKWCRYGANLAIEFVENS